MDRVIWKTLTVAEQQKLLQRPVFNEPQINNDVAVIIEEVKQTKDKALKRFTKLFDRVKITDFKVSEHEVRTSKFKLKKDRVAAIEFAFEQIYRFHQDQLPVTRKRRLSDGVYTERHYKAITKIGLYVPGGAAPLPSTVLMLGVPALIAGCSQKIICTPPKADGTVDEYILFAAKLCGIEKVYKLGGAQAIAAMAYGTESIPKVDKIFGPGNAWVTAAKLAVMSDPGAASCDLPAGPSELLIIADQYANATFIAADLLAQTEHGPDTQVFLVTDSIKLAAKIARQIELQLVTLRRQENIKRALQTSKIIVVDDLPTAFKISNCYGPEHLSIQVKSPKRWLNFIENAGAVFLGSWTAQVLGDYVIGNNHVLPTYGYAKSQSALGVYDFIKQIPIQFVSKKACSKIAPVAAILAELEQLDAHAKAVNLRVRAMRCP
jgi:histidinol dehydrogenase